MNDSCCLCPDAGAEYLHNTCRVLTLRLFSIAAVVFREQHQRAGVVVGPGVERHAAAGGRPPARVAAAAGDQRCPRPTAGTLDGFAAGGSVPEVSAAAAATPCPAARAPPPLPPVRRLHADPVQLGVAHRPHQPRPVPQRVPPAEPHLLVLVLKSQREDHAGLGYLSTGNETSKGGGRKVTCRQ